MQRMEELKEFLQEYRIERTWAKERNMENDCQCMLPELENKIDLLIQEQTALQESGEQETIKYLSFFRLMTSGYTQSYEQKTLSRCAYGVCVLETGGAV